MVFDVNYQTGAGVSRSIRSIPAFNSYVAGGRSKRQKDGGGLFEEARRKGGRRGRRAHRGGERERKNYEGPSLPQVDIDSAWA